MGVHFNSFCLKFCSLDLTLKAKMPHSRPSQREQGVWSLPGGHCSGPWFPLGWWLLCWHKRPSGTFQKTTPLACPSQALTGPWLWYAEETLGHVEDGGQPSPNPCPAHPRRVPFQQVPPLSWRSPGVTIEKLHLFLNFCNVSFTKMYSKRIASQVFIWGRMRTATQIEHLRYFGETAPRR